MSEEFMHSVDEPIVTGLVKHYPTKEDFVKALNDYWEESRYKVENVKEILLRFMSQKMLPEPYKSETNGGMYFGTSHKRGSIKAWEIELVTSESKGNK